MSWSWSSLLERAYFGQNLSNNFGGFTTCLLKRQIIVILEGKVGILKVKIGSCNSNFSWPASFSYKYKRFAMVFSKDKWSRLQAKRNLLKKKKKNHTTLLTFILRTSASGICKQKHTTHDSASYAKEASAFPPFLENCPLRSRTYLLGTYFLQCTSSTMRRASFLKVFSETLVVRQNPNFCWKVLCSRWREP